MAHPISSNKASVQETPYSDYTLQGKCGEGTYGIVYRAKREQNKVALKIFKEDGSGQAHAKRELKMLNASIGLANVLQVLGWGTDPKGQFFLVTELLKPLQTNSLDLRRIQTVSRGFFTGLDAMHKAGITHADINPKNLLVNEKGEGVLADLGNALYQGEKIDYFVQVIWYRDPRVFIDAPWDHTIDLWGMGCTLFQLAMNQPLFPGTTDKSYENPTWVQELHTLHLITQLLGPLPDELILSGKIYSRYFKKDTLQLPPLVSFPKQINDWNYLKAACQAHAQDKSLSNHFVSLIGKLVTYGEKISAEDALQSPFFASNQPKTT